MVKICPYMVKHIATFKGRGWGEGLKSAKSIKNAIDFNRIFLKIDSKF
jgi:hypothetical protein